MEGQLEGVIQQSTHQNQLPHPQQLKSKIRNRKVLMESKSQDLNSNHETANKKSPEIKRKSSFRRSSLVKISTKRFWILPLNLLQMLLRECSVLLIVLETVILLLGYCVLVGLHFSFRYGYLYLLGKKGEDIHPFHDQLDDQNDNYEPISVPRNKTARG